MKNKTISHLEDITEVLHQQLDDAEGRTDLQYLMDSLTAAVRYCEADEQRPDALAVGELLRVTVDVMRRAFTGLGEVATITRTLETLDNRQARKIATELECLRAGR